MLRCAVALWVLLVALTLRHPGIGIYRQILPFIKPYKWMIFGTLALTFIGALMAQVNPLVLKYTVDEVEQLMKLPEPMNEGMQVLIIISAILLGKLC